eukprot:9485429-Pyramimonas_sp.AAC.1
MGRQARRGVSAAKGMGMMAVRPEYLPSPSRVASYWAAHLNPAGKRVPSVAKDVDVTIELDLG